MSQETKIKIGKVGKYNSYNYICGIYYCSICGNTNDNNTVYSFNGSAFNIIYYMYDCSAYYVKGLQTGIENIKM